MNKTSCYARASELYSVGPALSQMRWCKMQTLRCTKRSTTLGPQPTMSATARLAIDADALELNPP
jgi:hypothetical protein